MTMQSSCHPTLYYTLFHSFFSNSRNFLESVSPPKPFHPVLCLVAVKEAEVLLAGVLPVEHQQDAFVPNHGLNLPHL